MLGIPELPADSFSLRESALYCYFSPAIRDAVTLLIRHTNSSKRSNFVIDCSEYDFFAELDPQTQSTLSEIFASKRHPAYFWHSTPNKTEQRNLKNLLSESQRLHPRPNTLLIVTINAHNLANCTSTQRCKQFAQWARWAQEQQLTVLFLVYGHYQSLRAALIKESDYIAGMLSLQPVNKHQTSIQLHYWHSNVDVVADRAYILASENNGPFSIISNGEQETTVESTTAIDEANILIAAPALLGSDQLVNNLTIAETVMANSVRDNNSLMESITHLDAATVVFSCNTPNDARDVAIMCYELRSKYGGRPKLIIREVRPCLRYSDTRFLLRGGANLVVPHTVSFTDFLDQIDALQGQVMIRSLPTSLNDMLESWSGISQRGYFAPQEFVRHAQLALDASRQDDLDLVLLLLKPSASIAIEHCLSLCSMSRNGDLITVCDGELYILFQACRAADADTALRNCFALPPKEIFAETLQFSEVADIEEAVASILPARNFISTEHGQQLLSLLPNQMGRKPSSIAESTAQRVVAKSVTLISRQNSL